MNIGPDEVDGVSMLLPQMMQMHLNDEPEAERIFGFTPRADEKMTAEDYAAESLAADLDQWIVFNPNDTQQNLELWLESNKPSEISREDNIGWICIDGNDATVADPPDVMGLQKAWEDLKTSNAPVTYDNICKLALGYNATVGKWLFHVDTGYKVDLLWRIVATGLVYGSLGKIANFAKVSPVNPTVDKCRHVVCIYNRNFMNEAEVFALENEIRMAGIKCPMKYKPDVYTYCGIYVNNQWSLRPTIFSSNYDIRSLSSSIVNHRTNDLISIYHGPQKRLFSY